MNIKKRDIVTAVLLSIVTCGIYAIYWCICLGKEAVSVKDANDDGLLEILLLIFFAPVGLFLAEKKLTEGCAEKGIAHSDNSIVYLILGLCGLSIVGLCMLQNDLNKIAGPEA